MGDKDLMFGLLICMLGGIIVLYSLMRIYFNKRQKKKTLEPKFCIEKKGKKQALFSRKDIQELFEKAVKDGIGKKITVQDWMDGNLL